MPFPAARCLFIASGHGSGRLWNIAAVSLFDGENMPQKRLEGRSLTGRLVYTLNDAGTEKKTARPVSERTRDTGSGWQTFSDNRGKRSIGIPVHKRGV